MLNTPILFLIFNRPDHIALVFNEIKKQQPKYFYIHADGPRSGNQDDIKKCQVARSIIEQIDWECELHTLFRDENLGCGKGPASAITWFFENVSEGIIIEDDCIPHPDFFNYCSELLNKYRDDSRIMVIGATTYQDNYPCEYSYTFSAYGTMAAWATWKRVWDKYDYSLSYFTRHELKTKLRKYFYSRFEYTNWLGLYDWIVKDGFSSYWDWQLHFITFFNEGIAIRPKFNMISNIGIGIDATHTNYEIAAAFQACRPTFGCFPLSHPPLISVNKKYDAAYYKKMYSTPVHTRIFQVLHKAIFSRATKNSIFGISLLNYYRNLKTSLLNFFHKLY